jgi:hypothetical protein
MSSQILLKRDTKRDSGIVKAFTFIGYPARLFVNAHSLVAIFSTADRLPINIEAGKPHILKRCTAEKYAVDGTPYYIQNTPRKGITQITTKP